MKTKLYILIFGIVAVAFLSGTLFDTSPIASTDAAKQVSDHFDGNLYFNPDTSAEVPAASSQEPRRGISGWFWRWIFYKKDWPQRPEMAAGQGTPRPVNATARGELQVTTVGHSTFLIQMDGVNILLDPIWSERCSPVSWAGPKRYQAPGIRFEDLPPIDVVLISHNHYDHCDLPTLEHLAGRGTPRAVVTSGNRELVRETGIAQVEDLDWWQSTSLSPDVKVTVVPARHFSARSLWDRNKTLWGGFVISGPSGNIYYAGDTGYGPHFREIGRRFAPIRMALLPISPYRPANSQDAFPTRYANVHIGPVEAVQAHIDLGAQMSVAAHFQVFQLGFDGFEDAVNELAKTLKKQRVASADFIAPFPGQAIVPRNGENKPLLTSSEGPVRLKAAFATTAMP